MPASSAPPSMRPVQPPGGGGVPARGARFRGGSRGGGHRAAPPELPKIGVVEVDPNFKPRVELIPTRPPVIEPSPPSGAEPPKAPMEENRRERGGRGPGEGGRGRRGGGGGGPRGADANRADRERGGPGRPGGAAPGRPGAAPAGRGGGGGPPGARPRASLSGPPGPASVSSTYGRPGCRTAVREAEGFPPPVLTRALEPLAGLATMRRRRGGVPDRELCWGPARLCAALGVTGRLDGVSLQRGVLRIVRNPSRQSRGIIATPRIGISRAADWPLRFLIEGSPWVSR